jgi:hypothetical protein
MVTESKEQKNFTWKELGTIIIFLRVRGEFSFNFSR